MTSEEAEIIIWGKKYLKILATVGRVTYKFKGDREFIIPIPSYNNFEDAFFDLLDGQKFCAQNEENIKS